MLDVEKLGVELLGELPLVREMREAADNGTPLVVANPEHAQSRALRGIAQRIMTILATRPAETAPAIHWSRRFEAIPGNALGSPDIAAAAP